MQHSSSHDGVSSVHSRLIQPQASSFWTTCLHFPLHTGITGGSHGRFTHSYSATQQHSLSVPLSTKHLAWAHSHLGSQSCSTAGHSTSSLHGVHGRHSQVGQQIPPTVGLILRILPFPHVGVGQSLHCSSIEHFLVPFSVVVSKQVKVQHPSLVDTVSSLSSVRLPIRSRQVSVLQRSFVHVHGGGGVLVEVVVVVVVVVDVVVVLDIQQHGHSRSSPPKFQVSTYGRSHLSGTSHS